MRKYEQCVSVFIKQINQDDYANMIAILYNCDCDRTIQSCICDQNRMQVLPSVTVVQLSKTFYSYE